MLFLYCVDGRLTAAQHHSLVRLAAEPEPLLTICAAPTCNAVPADVVERSTAVLWKGLSGFDFSAYAIALRTIAAYSPGADVFVMNDSVLGPLRPLRPFWDADRPALYGFTGSAVWENHVQSYAYFLCDVTPDRLRHLATVFPGQWAFNRFEDVVFWQETRFARLVARRADVGSRWFSSDPSRSDLPLFRPLELIDEGFPFMKRSHFGKWRGIADTERLDLTLRRFGHPEMTR